jgi:small subunit ribosomal protein S3
MGQKISPLGFRIGITEPWRARWVTTNKKEFAANVVQDQKIRAYVNKHHGHAGISRIDIERTREKIKVIAHVAKPALLIGRKGATIDRIEAEISQLCGDRKVSMETIEITNPDSDAVMIAEGIAGQLKRRAAFRRVMKKQMEMALQQQGVRGIKMRLSGRLGGADMARTVIAHQGQVPLQSLNVYIQFASVTCFTIWGSIGIKVWVNHGLYQDLGVRREAGARTARAGARRG